MYLQVRVAPRNLDTGCMPRDSREHVRTHAMPHQAREEEEDKGELERDQKQNILIGEEIEVCLSTPTHGVGVDGNRK